MSNFKEIAEELQYRVKSSINLKDNNHLSELVGILRENKWTENAIIEFLRNLTEKREKGQTWVTKTGHAGWKPSEERARYGMKSAEIAKAYVAGKISDDELDKQEKDGESEEEPEEKTEKELEQDIDYDNPPESIQKEIQPDDEEFEQQENITPHTYNPDEIEVGGEKVKLPVTEEFLKEKIFKQPPHKFPNKYIKALVRVMNTQKIDKDNPPITSFTTSDEEREQVGAGQISAQTSELLMLMSTSLSDEESDLLYEVLEKTSDSTESKNQILDKEWIQASKSMRSSALKNIREQYGPDAVVEFSGWDSEADFEDGIGLDYKKKGFSTDTVFRVKTPDGKSHITEISNKKDLTVHLGSPSAAATEKGIEEAGVEIKDSQKVTKYTKNAQVRSEKRLNETTQDDLDRLEKMDNMSDDELIDYLSTLPDEIRAMFTAGDKKKGLKLKPDARKYLKLSKIPQPWDTSNQEFLDKAKELGIDLGKKGISQKGANKTAIFMNYLLYADELNNGKTDGPARDFIQNQVGIIGQEPFPEGSQRDVQNNFIKNLDDPRAREVVMGTIKDKFPLRNLMEGEESMVLGSFRMSPKVCMEIFGTTDYEKVQENLSVKKDKDGNYYLVYSAETGGEEIQIAHLKARGKGIGYSSITFEMSMAEDFKHTTYCANMKGNNPPKEEDLTDAEKKEVKKLVRKYGECK